MRIKLATIFQDKFIKNNSIFFVGSMMVAALNYFYHPILSRMMSIEDFGEVQALIAIVLQTGIIFGVFNIMGVHAFANASKENKANKISVLSQIYKMAVIGITIFSIFFILLSSVLKDFLHFQSIYPFFALAGILLISIPMTFRRSYLQGTNNFLALSISGIIQAGSRLLFAIMLVWIGLASFGAIFAIVIATALMLWYLYAKTKNSFHLALNEKITFNSALFKELRYGLLILCVSGATIFFYTADMIIVKHYFSPIDAGLYGGVSTVARIIIFATSSITAVLLPVIKLKNSPRENSKVFTKALMLVIAIGVILLLLFSFFPKEIIHLLVGSRYTECASLLPRLSLVLFLVSIINLFSIYFLSLRKYILIAIAAFGILITTALVMLSHAALLDVINSFLFGCMITLSLLVIYFIVNFKLESKKYENN